MSTNISLTVDNVFRYVFGSERSTSVLRAFLSAVQTNAGYPAVTEVEIRNPFNLQDSSEDKLSIVDVRARDETGRIFTIEVQTENQASFGKRSLYCWAHTYAGGLKQPEPFEQISPIVGVNILDYVMFPETQRFHNVFSLQSIVGNPVMFHTDSSRLHYLELPKLPEYPSTKLENWLYYIEERGKENAMEDPIILKILKDDPEIADAEDEYRRFITDE